MEFEVQRRGAEDAEGAQRVLSAQTSALTLRPLRLCVFAWYCCRLLPRLPRWFVWAWLLTSPWTLNLSTVIYNPSYVLAGGILFFVGALEVCPFTRRGLVPARLADASMGFGLLWAMQLHMSWVVL